MNFNEFKARYTFNIKNNILGQGTYGKVVKAYDNVLDKYIAIKIAEVKIANGVDLSLQKEVRLMQGIPEHANVANYQKCYRFQTDVGEYDYGIIQYYPDGNLSQLLATVKLNAAEKKAMLLSILKGLKHLHDNKIVHRDIKPSNILISKRNVDGKTVFIPKLADFGLSKLFNEDAQSRFTNSIGGGTLEYSAPEQLLGKELRKNADLWSIGIVAYELYFGQRPFSPSKDAAQGSASREREVYDKIVNAAIPENVNQLEHEVKELIKACLVKDPQKRYKTCDQVINLIDDETDTMRDPEPIQIPKPTPSASTPKPLYVKKGLVALGVLALIVVGLFFLPDLLKPKTKAEFASLKTYKVNGEIYDIPIEDLDEFLSDFPDAQEVKTFIVQNDTFDIALSKVSSFLKKYPEAKPYYGQNQIPLKKDDSLANSDQDGVENDKDLNSHEKGEKNPKLYRKYTEGKIYKEATIIDQISMQKHSLKFASSRQDSVNTIAAIDSLNDKNQMQNHAISNINKVNKEIQKHIENENFRSAYANIKENRTKLIDIFDKKIKIEIEVKISSLFDKTIIAEKRAQENAALEKEKLKREEDLAWEVVKKKNTIKEYKMFVNTYPEGKYGPLASKNIAKITEKLLSEHNRFKIDFRSYETDLLDSDFYNFESEIQSFVLELKETDYYIKIIGSSPKSNTLQEQAGGQCCERVAWQRAMNIKLYLQYLGFSSSKIEIQFTSHIDAEKHSVFYAAEFANSNNPIDPKPSYENVDCNIFGHNYSFNLYEKEDADKTFIAAGIVIDGLKETPLKWVKVRCYNMTDGKTIAKSYSGYDGRFRFKLLNGKEYKFTAELSSHQNNSVTASSTELTENMFVNIPLLKN